MMEIRKSQTTSYHPQGDPQPERFNWTLLSILGALGCEKKRQWSKHVGYLVHAYNSIKCDATGYSPYYLMFEREARLPIDLCFGTSPDCQGEGCHSRYVAKLKDDLKTAYKLASDAACKTNIRNKRSYDKRVRFQTLMAGDRVLLKNLGLKGKHKLESCWNPIPYVVLGKMHNLPVYKVEPEDGAGGVKTLHRDNFLPIGQLVRIPTAEDQSPQKKTITRATAQKKATKEQHDVRSASQECADSSSDMEYYGPEKLYSTYLKEILEKEAIVTKQSNLVRGDGDSSLLPSKSDKFCRRDIVEEDSRKEDGDYSSVPEGESSPESLHPCHDKHLETITKAKVTDEPENRPKRTVKPVIRLTYDKI